MRFVIFLLFFMILGCQSTPQTPEEIHKEVLTLDTHIDFNTKDFQKHRNYGQDLNTQVNLIKMEKGQLFQLSLNALLKLHLYGLGQNFPFFGSA